jgi:hypothetical protein
MEPRVMLPGPEREIAVLSGRRGQKGQISDHPNSAQPPTSAASAASNKNNILLTIVSSLGSVSSCSRVYTILRRSSSA